MDIQKIHLDRSKRGSIVCPNCGQIKAVNALPFKTNQPIKVHCKCKHQHLILFEQRAYNRRTVRIKGKLEKSIAGSPITSDIRIDNISPGGAQFIVKNASSFVVNDQVQLSFIIPDQFGSPIKAKAIIKYIKKNQIGVEFEGLDKPTLALIQQYARDPAQAGRGQEADRRQKIRHQDEALCVSAVQRELQEFFSSARISPAITFAGNTWDEALRKFRLAWGSRHMCNRCHNVTDAESAIGSQSRCRRCNEGRYTANPKELWDSILRNSPNRERYLTLSEAVSATAMSGPEFTEIYEYGFLVPIRKHFYDNTLIGALQSAIEQSRSLGIDLSLENIDIARSKNKIRVIRKRNYDNDPDKITIGRSEVNDIVFYGATISRAHAYLYIDCGDNRRYLVDSKSSNGTFLNKRRLTPNQVYEIKDNDVIVFGNEVTVVYLSSTAFHVWLNHLAHSDGERFQSAE
jgi:hypothetical protein